MRSPFPRSLFHSDLMPTPVLSGPIPATGSPRPRTPEINVWHLAGSEHPQPLLPERSVREFFTCCIQGLIFTRQVEDA